jgi:hypothetical protein
VKHEKATGSLTQFMEEAIEVAAKWGNIRKSCEEVRESVVELHNGSKKQLGEKGTYEEGKSVS